MFNTNLTKAFIGSAVFILIITQLTGCGVNKADSTETKSPFFIGKWHINTILSNRYEPLETKAKMVYDDQMEAMLDSSYLDLRSDSSYIMQIGPDTEKGVWISDDDQKRLVLKTDKKTITRYLIEDKKNNSFWLKNIDDKHSTRMELIKK